MVPQIWLVKTVTILTSHNSPPPFLSHHYSLLSFPHEHTKLCHNAKILFHSASYHHWQPLQPTKTHRSQPLKTQHKAPNHCTKHNPCPTNLTIGIHNPLHLWLASSLIGLVVELLSSWSSGGERERERERERESVLDSEIRERKLSKYK